MRIHSAPACKNCIPPLLLDKQVITKVEANGASDDDECFNQEFSLSSANDYAWELPSHEVEPPRDCRRPFGL